MSEPVLHKIFTHWHALKLLPSAWLLGLQLLTLMILPFTTGSLNSNAMVWGLGTLALLLIAVIIKHSPIYSMVGFGLVLLALVLSINLLMGHDSYYLRLASNLAESSVYIYAAAGLLAAFAFLYNACQIAYPGSFTSLQNPTSRSWVELLFLSFSVQSNTGLSDITPVTSQARMLVALQMFVGVMYLALIVSRLIALQYIKHAPKPPQP
ncbi:MAG: two pore domain potassium channel family protein [Moraxellaceae bacterium]|nr:MAG: two pore domain potassium channel family protein [Moraxellaceae bacterium]